MQSLAQRIWSKASHCHIGDLAWQVAPQRDVPARLWRIGGEVVAWGWLEPPYLTFLVDPGRPELAGEVLAWAPDSQVIVLDAENHLIEALERNGYQRQDGPFHHYMSRELHDLPGPALPEGFVARPVGPEDMERRVAVHRAAWHPSKFTTEKYRDVTSAWPYRADLDWVVEAPDGRFAANCLIWLDEHNKVAELEPVGADPDFRRLGLATAVCLAAMRAAGQAGAQQAIVYPVDGRPAVGLYRNLGFRPYARTFTFAKNQ
jgi:ribosomal protein S18 acetylase RimI-like enzyme